MGTLSNIRKVSPYLLGIFAVVFIGFMVLSDADINTLIKQGQNMQNAFIGKVNGEKILYKDYEEKVKTQMEQERAQSQNPDAEIDEVRIRQTVWNQMVDNILINQAAKKLGITVTKEEIRDQLIENPPDYLKKSFTDSSGKFMRDIYLELVTKPENYVKYLGDPNKMSPQDKEAAVNRLRKDLIEIEDYIRKSNLYKTLQNTIGLASSVISPAFASDKYKLENSSADVKVIAFRANSIKPESIKISDNEIRKYYDEHKKYYKQDAQAKIKYINFQMKPSADDSARAGRHLQDIITTLNSAVAPESKDSIFDVKMSEYGGETSDFTAVNKIDPETFKTLSTLTKGAIAGPIMSPKGALFIRFDDSRTGQNPTVKASHILIKFNDNKDSALAVANAILKEAKSGKDFAELAKTKSEDQGSAVNGGDLGSFGKGQMVKPFEDAAFAASVGQIVGPVESQFGYHIIKVTERNNEEIKYSSINIVPTISNATKNSLFREAYSVKTQVEGGTSIDVLAKRLNLKAVETPYFSKEKPVFNSWYITNQAFDLENGKMIEPIELKFYGIICAQVTGKKTAGVVSLEDKKEEIKNILIKKKQLDMLKDKATAAYSKVSSIGDLQAAYQQDPTLQYFALVGMKGNGAITGLAKDPVLNEAIFNSAKSGIYGPIRGEFAYYIVQVENRQVPSENSYKDKLPEFAKTLSADANQNAFYLWYQKVKKDADIVDERAKYFKDF